MISPRKKDHVEETLLDGTLIKHQEDVLNLFMEVVRVIIITLQRNLLVDNNVLNLDVKEVYCNNLFW